MELIIGRQYKKEDFRIGGISKQMTEHIVGGELYTFFSIVGKYDDIIESDGFVYEVMAEYIIIPHGVKTGLCRHVFARKKIGEEFTYIGKGRYEARYDDKHNKIFW
ncbi:MAG: hypothetical protein LBC27_03655 [Spirochaetaceae bacterium]|jgi:hypothetical protein|nr:hypothetical protein [Spirochaetaceae bacterium]